MDGGLWLRRAVAGIVVCGAVAALGSGTVSAAKPGAPTITSVTPSGAKVTVVFTAPVSDGGEPITGYRVQCASSDGGALRVKVGGTALTQTVTGLTGGKTYTCRVRAQNADGLGPFSQPSASFVPVTVPGVPQTVSLIVLDLTTAWVGFAPPTNDGGQPITKYTARCTSNDGGTTPARHWRRRRSGCRT